ncbi:hypothetical protein [Wukongibacter sp. M2B1]|uniref:hypothetical protein n=1 Tax=Wukongibacter sp. M2B1 TaxID=3088895 RepID=UPI003D7A637A
MSIKSKKYIWLILGILVGIVIGQMASNMGYNIMPKKEPDTTQIIEEKLNDDNNVDEIDTDIKADTSEEKQEPKKEADTEDTTKEIKQPIENIPEKKETQKTAQEIIAEAQREEEEKRKQLEDAKKKQEEEKKSNEKKEVKVIEPPQDTESGKRNETRTERIPEPEAPERDFTVIKESKNAKIYFEKGYNEKAIEEIVKYYEEEVYPDLTSYFGIKKPRAVKFYFLSKKSNRGIKAHLPTTVADPDGFYSYGHIYIFPEDIMHNMKRIIRHEYTHHLNNHYYDGGIPMYMDEGMAYYIMNYYYMDENEKNTVANVYGVKTNYETYSNSKYVFLVLDRYLGDNSSFPKYFKYLKEYTHAKAFEMTFGITEKEFKEIYNKYVK